MNSTPLIEGIEDAVKGVFYQYDKHQTLWFIASLYVYSLLFYWVDRLCYTPKRLLAGCLLLILLGQTMVYTFHCPMLPLKLNYAPWAISIMGFGKLYRLYEDKLDEKLMSYKYVIISFVLFVFLIHTTGVRINYFGSSNWFMAIVIPLTGTHWMLYLSKHITVKCKPLLFIGANSLVYFAVHRQILNVVEVFARKAMNMHSIQPSLFTNLLEVSIIAAMIVIPVWIINKYIPQVTGKGWKLWK